MDKIFFCFIFLVGIRVVWCEEHAWFIGRFQKSRDHVISDVFRLKNGHFHGFTFWKLFSSDQVNFGLIRTPVKNVDNVFADLPISPPETIYGDFMCFSWLSAKSVGKMWNHVNVMSNGQKWPSNSFEPKIFVTELSRTILWVFPEKS